MLAAEAPGLAYQVSDGDGGGADLAGGDVDLGGLLDDADAAVGRLGQVPAERIHPDGLADLPDTAGAFTDGHITREAASAIGRAMQDRRLADVDGRHAPSCWSPSPRRPCTGTCRTDRHRWR